MEVDDSIGGEHCCAVCGGKRFAPFARRSDGKEIVKCVTCGMGVIQSIPDDLAALYGDDYFGLGGPNVSAIEQGYADYAFTAEHSVAWAAALVELLRPGGGRVLDIGCADGHLLAKLGSGYTKFGVEVNEAAGNSAARRGVTMIGRDICDPALIERYRGSFDVITAIAVFEHLRDIRGGMEAALSLLQADGVLLFEVPLMSSVHDNTVWLTSSLEHVWYPTEQGLQRLVQTELGAELVGCELFINGYASTYVGIVFREAARAAEIRGIAARVLLRKSPPASPEEARARMLTHLMHAATATHDDVEVLADYSSPNRLFMRRLAGLWNADLYRYQQSQADAQARERRLQADLDAEQSDRVLSETELTTSLQVARAQLRAAQADLAAMVPLQADRARVEAVLSSRAWRATAALIEIAHRHPRLARHGYRIARFLWWTARGQLLNQLRLRRQALAPLPVGSHPQTKTHRKWFKGTLRHSHPLNRPEFELRLMDVTGHRPRSMPQAAEIDGPLVSVVITSFNYGHYVVDAVASALAQTFKDLEVIVVEGGSTDSLSRIVVSGLHGRRVRVLMQGEGHRAGANRNFGISQARGRYICCLDADDTLAPTYIEKAVFLLERHGYDVVSGGMQSVGVDNTPFDVMERPNLEDILSANHVLTCAVFRRSFWEESGGYRDVDASVSGYVYEDWAFWIRLAALGARFRNLHRDPVLRYRVHGASLSRGKDAHPMSRQAELVREMNSDVLVALADRIAFSKERACLQYGTPFAPPASIVLDREPSERRPTVLLAMPFLILGGAERLLSAVVGHLVHEGWRVVVTTTVDVRSGHGDTTAWFEQYTSDIFHLPRCLSPELWEDMLQHIVQSRAVDIVWVVGSAFVYDSLRGLRAAHPTLRVADLLFNTVAHTANNRRRRELIDLNFVESAEVQKWLLAHGEHPSRIRMVESGVDLARHQPAGPSDALRRQISANPGNLIVGFSGRWSEEKNPLGFVEIARLVDPKLAVHFVMTGTGPQRPLIERAISGAGLPEGRFHLLGDVPEIEPILASLDLLVIPSRLDGRPVVALEALASGVPILASRVGALPELVEEGSTGWLFDPEDAAAFAERIERVANDRTTLEHMRHRARAYAEANLDLRRMLTAYTEGLKSLLPEDRRG